MAYWLFLTSMLLSLHGSADLFTKHGDVRIPIIAHLQFVTAKEIEMPKEIGAVELKDKISTARYRLHDLSPVVTSILVR